MICAPVLISFLCICLLSVQTRHMVGAMPFSQMKEGVRIVCIVRGGIIDERALVATLDSGKIAGTALDVFLEVPAGKTEADLHSRVIATSHIGAQTVEARPRAGDDIVSKFLNVLKGNPLLWRVV